MSPVLTVLFAHSSDHDSSRSSLAALTPFQLSLLGCAYHLCGNAMGVLVSILLLLLLLLLQGVCNGLAVATVSAPNHPPRLMLAPVPASLTGSSSDSSSSWDWSPVQALEPDLSLLPEAAAALADMQCEVLDIVPTVGDTDLHFQAIVQVGLAVLYIGFSVGGFVVVGLL
jgi:hypothetical protein